MITHNLVKRMGGTKRSVYPARAGDEDHALPFLAILNSTCRFVALSKTAASRIALLLVMMFGITFVHSGHAAAKVCVGPVTGEVKSSAFHFSFESWVKQILYDDITKYQFARCVQNNHIRELWVKWESTGLKGTTKAKDAIYIYFEEEDDSHITLERSLWYGPAPAEVTPSTILRPNEARVQRRNDARIYLAQLDNTVTLTEAFDNREVMIEVLNRLAAADRSEGFALRSGGRIAVPTSTEALGRLMKGDILDPGEFVAVEITIVEQFTLSDDVPLGTLNMSIRVATRELQAMQQIKGSLPRVFITADDDLLRERLQLSDFVDLSGSIQLDRPFVDFQDQSPTALKFPVQRVSGRLRFQFGDNEGSHLIIPFGVASGH